MVALDTLKVRIPRAVVLDYDGKAFNERREVDSIRGTVKETSHLNKLVIGRTCGVNAIVIGEESATVEVSAKILGEMYPSGINLDTVDRVPRAINAAGVLSIDAAAFIAGAEVLRCDAAVNLPVESVQESLRHLRVLGVSDRYHFKAYEKTGIVFTREAKTVAERLTFYDKHGEMLMRKNAKWIATGSLDPEPFRGMLRAETNMKHYTNIRELFGVQERALLDVLSSDRNPVLTIFERIADHSRVRGMNPKFAELCSMRGGVVSIVKRRGWIEVFEVCDWQWDMVRVFIRGTYHGKSKPSRILSEARAIFQDELRKKHFPEVAKDRIAEVHQLLKQAA